MKKIFLLIPILFLASCTGSGIKSGLLLQYLYTNETKVFVKRDFTTFYKQTILGPLWFFVQPLISTIIFTLVFNRVAKIPTGELPPILFYMSGIIAWNYFSGCFISTSATFTANAHLFDKVYFPRIIIPLSKVISGLAKFGIQLIFLVVNINNNKKNSS